MKLWIILYLNKLLQGLYYILSQDKNNQNNGLIELSLIDKSYPAFTFQHYLLMNDDMKISINLSHCNFDPVTIIHFKCLWLLLSITVKFQNLTSTSLVKYCFLVLS